MSLLARLVLLLYGLALIAGGVMGYQKAQSLPSLLGGCVSGVVAILGFFVSFKRRALGLSIGILTALALGVMMGKRWIDKADRTIQDVPFLIAAGSAVVLILLLAGLFSGPKKSKA